VPCPAENERVTVEFNYDTAVDTWSTLTCTFEDDGSATIPAAELGRPDRREADGSG
jgi:hypothetical protein